jgi:hypothetical protein
MMTLSAKRAARICLMMLAALIGAGVAPVGGLVPAASAGMRLDIETELQLLREGHAQVHIGKARYRFAVFTFDDPDGTGLGNAVASILSHDLLMNSKVNSIGVLRYEGGLGKASDERRLRYFDKVEPLIESQGVQVAIWGTIRRSGEKVQIDSFTQLSPAVLRSAFSFSFRLPPAMGGGRLVHRIAPDRMLAQRLILSPEQARSLSSVAESVDRLRAGPKDSLPFVGRLPLGSVYYLEQRQGDWVKVGMQSGQSGWLRASGLCAGPCAPLLAVSQFASGLMAYDDRGNIPESDAKLAPDALAFIDQLWAVEALNRAPANIAEQEALYRLKRWCPARDEGNGNELVPPGGAATCNLRGLVRLVGPLRSAAEGSSSGTPLRRDLLHSVADDWARASLSDPRYVPTLQNLATLFAILGDAEREKLASRLADDASAAERGADGETSPTPESKPAGAQPQPTGFPPGSLEQNLKRAD